MSFPIPDVKLTQFQHRVWTWLQSRAHLRQGICQGPRALARIFGVSVRYIQCALKFFVDHGVLRRERDYGLHTRRRFYVVLGPIQRPIPGAGKAQPDRPFSGAVQCAEQAHPDAPSVAVPPKNPPVEVSGESEEKESGGRGPEPPPLDVVPPELIERGRAVLGEQSPGESWFRCQIERFGLDWLRAAVEQAAIALKRDGSVGPGYIFRTLVSFERVGGPAPALALAAPAVLGPDARAVRSIVEGQGVTGGRLREWFTRVVNWPVARFEAALAELRAQKPTPGATLQSPPGAGPKVPLGNVPESNHTPGVNP